MPAGALFCLRLQRVFKRAMNKVHLGRGHLGLRRAYKAELAHAQAIF